MFERFNDQLIRSKCAIHRVAPDALDQRGIARDNSALRTTQQFVATKRSNIYTCRKAVFDERFINALCLQIN